MDIIKDMKDVQIFDNLDQTLMTNFDLFQEKIYQRTQQQILMYVKIQSSAINQNNKQFQELKV